MCTPVTLNTQPSEKENIAILISPNTDLAFLSKLEVEYAKSKIKDGTLIIHINQLYRNVYLIIEPKGDNDYIIKEQLRQLGYELCIIANKEKNKALQITTETDDPQNILAFTEGFLLSNYQFLKYQTDKKYNTIKQLTIISKIIQKKSIEELSIIVEATHIARDLVNEPLIYLTAEQLSKEIKQLGEDVGFNVEILNKLKIQSLKMGGLLAVNAGSPNPPTFNVLEYKPSESINKKPYILVGKGVVYDTGGLSLKPTTGSMDMMKCDMAGAAAVIGAMYAISKNKLPLYIIGLIPATENRPGGNAITPGDVITMHNGTTVEVLNTDAEGRLILGDALSYASKYNPELVIDLATLTGSAARAIGKEGIVYMGTASEKIKTDLSESGYAVHERLVEFPLWDEYEKYIESDIADIKNIGGSDAGAITAGKFLQHFTNYPWLHLDIAGTAFITHNNNYKGKNGTGVGVRLLYDFLIKQIKTSTYNVIK